MHNGFCLEKLKGRDYLGDLGIDGGIALKWILRKWGLSIWVGLICIVFSCIRGRHDLKDGFRIW